MIINNESNANITELYKIFRNNILFSDSTKNIKSVLITSTKLGEGNTSTAANLAITMAKSDKKTLLVDCNLINPCIHRLFNSNEYNELSEVFGKNGFDSRYIIESNVDNLYIVAASELSSKLTETDLCEKIKELLKNTQCEYDLVVLDTPPVMNASYVQIISQYVDGCILVIASGESTIKEIENAKQLLKNAKANILGAVLNKTKNKLDNPICEGQCKNTEKIESNMRESLPGFFRIRRKKIKKKVMTTSIFIAIAVSIMHFYTIDCSEVKAAPVETVKDKKCYLSNPNNQIKIVTDFDESFNEGGEAYIYKRALRKTPNVNFYDIPVESIWESFYLNFPVQTKRGKTLNIDLINMLNDNYTVKIVGDNYKEEPTVNTFIPWKWQWQWTPKESGIFYIEAFNFASELVGKRKVYVNSTNDKYLQIGDLKTEEIDNITHVHASIEEHQPDDFSKNNMDKIMKFTIGEPEVWSKTIKNYGDAIRNVNGYYDINEQSNNFEFHNGSYLIGAFLKREHSVEYEDAKAIVYKKSGLKDLKLDLEMNVNNKKDNQGKYPMGSKFTFSAISQMENINPNLEYAFLLYDERGKRLIKGYDSNNKFYWTPSQSGKYIIYARVKQRDGDRNLPNSYEVEKSCTVDIASGSVGKIEIDNIQINNKTLLTEKNNNNLQIKSHKLYKIKVNAKRPRYGNNLMYKIYAIHDGIYISLGDFSELNIIPFYPKSYGDYKLIVCVKDSLSGSDEDRQQFDIKVNK